MTEQPLITVHRGNPDPGELAALISALMAAESTEATTPGPEPRWRAVRWRGPGWNRPQLRNPLR